jgi:hypothetical protein
MSLKAIENSTNAPLIIELTDGEFTRYQQQGLILTDGEGSLLADALPGKCTTRDIIKEDLVDEGRVMLSCLTNLLTVGRDQLELDVREIQGMQVILEEINKRIE